MRTQPTPGQEGVSQGSEENPLGTTTLSRSLSFSSHISYHEMEVIPVRDVNVLEQLQANLETLADLQQRMNFMMREIRYLMKV